MQVNKGIASKNNNIQYWMYPAALWKWSLLFSTPTNPVGLFTTLVTGEVCTGVPEFWAEEECLATTSVHDNILLCPDTFSSA